MRIAGEKYNTTIMTDEEALIFTLSALEVNEENNIQDIQIAIDDMHMVDSLLYMRRLHLALRPHISKTRKGYLRKNCSLLDAMESIIEGRVKMLANN